MTGVQRYALEVARELNAMADDDLQVSIFAGHEGRGQNLRLPVETSLVPAGGSMRGLLWEQTVLKRMARKAHIDVLFNPANVAPVGADFPQVVTIHDLAFLIYPQFFSRSFATYYRTIMPRIVRESAAIIAVSENTRADLIRILSADPGKIAVVPPAASREFTHAVTKGELDRVRDRYRLPNKFFLSVSSLEPRKNLKRLIEAYRVLPRSVTDEFALVLVGAGNSVFADPDISASLQQDYHGDIHAPGYIPAEELPALYRMATALVFPSLYEGFGLPVVEAMAAATPVITSNRSSLPEVAGNAAVLIDPESIEELAAAMELMATDSGTRNLLIERGKKRAAGYSWSKTASGVMRVLQAVGDGSPIDDLQ
jgi:glycosyltransferase involved in cell wall biosynthesis